MCAITGYASAVPDPSGVARVLAMLRALRHRGPDGCGVHVDGGLAVARSPEWLGKALQARGLLDLPSHVVLGHARLAITGGADAAQPLLGRSSRIALAHNGEVYNHHELRALARAPSGTPRARRAAPPPFEGDRALPGIHHGNGNAVSKPEVGLPPESGARRSRVKPPEERKPRVGTVRARVGPTKGAGPQEGAEESDSHALLDMLEREYLRFLRNRAPQGKGRPRSAAPRRPPAGAAGGALARALRSTLQAAEGMVAVAATDGNEVALARDAVGKKPLYYVMQAPSRGATVRGAGGPPPRLAWASERKALRAVADAFPGCRVQTLEPGEVLSWKPRSRVAPRRVRATRLPQPPPVVRDGEVAVARYGAALARAVARRTEGVERAALLFSGGVDSALVALLLRRAGVDVTGYVAGEDGAADMVQAGAVAHAMDLPLRVVTLVPRGVAAELPRILRASELHGPLMTEVAVPVWFSARAAAAEGHRIMFTGQAADELFGGYDWYRAVVAAEGHEALHARLWEDLRALPQDTLEREDRLLMAWGIEGRAPFLDLAVIEDAMRIHPALKVTGADDHLRKHPHRALACRLGVPEQAAMRPKEPMQEGARARDLLRDVAALLLRDAPAAATKAAEPGGRRGASRGGAQSAIPDFGSLHRYGLGGAGYAPPEVVRMLRQVVARHRILVADVDGTCRLPRRRSPAGIGGAGAPPAARAPTSPRPAARSPASREPALRAPARRASSRRPRKDASLRLPSR